MCLRIIYKTPAAPVFVFHSVDDSALSVCHLGLFVEFDLVAIEILDDGSKTERRF